MDLKALSSIHFLHPLWLLALPPLLLLTVWLARSMGREYAWRRGVGGVIQAAHESECLAQPTDVGFD